MATVRLKYVDHYRDNRGKERWYYRRQGRRFALPGNPGEPEFMRAYEDAAAVFTTDKRASLKAPAAGTFDALASAYYASPSFLTLRPLTKRTYRLIIDRWTAEHGRKRVVHLQRHHVVQHMGERMQASGPHAANSLLEKLRVLMRFALDNGWRRDDPTTTIRKIRAPSEGFVTWSEDDVKAFEDKWAPGTRERLAFALLLYTGQRRGDVVRLGWQHVSGGMIRMKQEKTGTRLAIPIHAQLQAALDATPRDNLTFLVTAYGRNFTSAGFGNAFRDWCDAAGLKDRSAHGLRKAAARRLAEAGCSASQIAALTGHKSLGEVTRYTAAADQERLARDAVDKLGG